MLLSYTPSLLFIKTGNEEKYKLYLFDWLLNLFNNLILPCSSVNKNYSHLIGIL